MRNSELWFSVGSLALGNFIDLVINCSELPYLLNDSK